MVSYRCWRDQLEKYFGLALLAIGAVATSAITAEAQSGKKSKDERASAAVTEAATAMRDYAQKAIVCDKVSPGVWTKTRNELRKLGDPFWTPDIEASIVNFGKSPAVAAGVDKWKDAVAAHQTTLADLKAVCEEDVAQQRQVFMDKAEAMAFLLED